MDTSQNRDIGRRQALLGRAGKNVIPPQRIIQQQRRLSATESAHKLIPREHKELCPLCLFPSFIFDQRHKSHVHTGPTSPRLPGTFLCALCCNKNIQSKLCDIKILKQEIRAQSRLITPILHHKVNASNTRYRDKRLRVKHSQRRISALKRLIEQRHKENQHLKANNAKLRSSNQRRRVHLDKLQPKLHEKWECALEEYRKKCARYKAKEVSSRNISLQISLNKVIQLSDFYKLKVLPMMQSNKREYDQINLSMIQNIAVPSVFSIKQIRSFYNDPQNELFRFPVPSYYQSLQQQQQQQLQSPYNNRSSSISILSNLSPHLSSHKSYGNKQRTVSSVNEYRSSQYQIPLKSESPTTSDSHQSSRGSPLRRMFPFLTPPSTKRSASMSIQRSTTMSSNGTESRSLPKNLDELVLPPTFFNDDNVDHRTSSKSPKSSASPMALSSSKSMKYRDSNIGNQTPKYTAVRTASIAVRKSGKITKLNDNNTSNRISNRNRSRSLDAEHAVEHRLSAHSRLIHEPHIEHGICAALQYIVSFVLRAAKYLDIQLLYEMGLYRKKKGKFRMHTFILDPKKGKYYRLYWLKDIGNCGTHNHIEEERGDEVKDGQDRATSLPHFESTSRSRKESGGNILDFEHAMHLLEENINDFCFQCGVKQHKLHSFQFIANLIELVDHLKAKRDRAVKNDRERTVGIGEATGGRKSEHRRSGKKMSVNVIREYRTNVRLPTDMTRNESNTTLSNSSIDETLANSATDNIVISAVVDSDNEDWDFVELT